MKSFENINSRNIIKKEIVSCKAKDNFEFSKFLSPEETVTVCNCLYRTDNFSKILITGVEYPTLGWEHVVVRVFGRYPTHRQMILAKELFWKDDEVVFQVYPSKSRNVNHEEYTLHMWKDMNLYGDSEFFLIESIRDCYNRAKIRFDGRKKSMVVTDYYGTRIIVYSPMHWFTWAELSQEKKKFFGEDTNAVQIHSSRKIDDNPEYITMIWKVDERFRLPQKELV